MIRIRGLGALEAEVDGAPAQLGGPRQRGVLALLLDRPEEAAGYFSRAVEVARRWGAPVWERDAQAALSRLG